MIQSTPRKSVQITLALAKKDLRRHRLLIFTWCLTLLVSALFQSDLLQDSSDIYSLLAGVESHNLWILTGFKWALLYLILIPFLMMEDSTAQSESFLQTRPVAPLELAFSKILVFFLIIVAIPVVLDIALWLHKGLPTSKLPFALFDSAFFYTASAIYAALAFAARSTRWYWLFLLATLLIGAAVGAAFGAIAMLTMYSDNVSEFQNTWLGLLNRTVLEQALEVARYESFGIIAWFLSLLFGMGWICYLAAHRVGPLKIIVTLIGSSILIGAISFVWPWQLVPLHSFPRDQVAASAKVELTAQPGVLYSERSYPAKGSRSSKSAQASLIVPFVVRGPQELLWKVATFSNVRAVSTINPQKEIPLQFKGLGDTWFQLPNFTRMGKEPGSSGCASQADVNALLSDRTGSDTLEIAGASACPAQFHFVSYNPEDRELLRQGEITIYGDVTFTAYKLHPEYSLSLNGAKPAESAYPYAPVVRLAYHQPTTSTVIDERLFYFRLDPLRRFAQMGVTDSLDYLAYNPKRSQVQLLESGDSGSSSSFLGLLKESISRGGGVGPLTDRRLRLRPINPTAQVPLSTEWFEESELIAFRSYPVGTLKQKVEIKIGKPKVEELDQKELSQPEYLRGLLEKHSVVDAIKILEQQRKFTMEDHHVLKAWLKERGIESYTPEQAQVVKAIDDSFRAVSVFKDGEIVGIRLYAIRGGSKLARAGFQNSDIIVALNSEPFDSRNHISKLEEALRGAQPARIKIQRKGEIVEILLGNSQ